MRQRVRQRISSILADGGGGGGGSAPIDVDVVVTLAGGALLLACMEPSVSRCTSEAVLNGVSVDGGERRGFERKGGGGGSGDGSGGGGGSDRTASGVAVATAPIDDYASTGVGLFSGGREASLLMGYLCAAAATAEAAGAAGDGLVKQRPPFGDSVNGSEVVDASIGRSDLAGVEVREGVRGCEVEVRRYYFVV